MQPEPPKAPPLAGDDQSAVIRFLMSPAPYLVPLAVSQIQTHGAYVFLCGDVALKIKRAVRYDYMDLSTLDRRKAMLHRELDLNRAAAPMIYRDIVAVTREPDGQFALNGPGTPVEWVLRMHRFPAASELANIAARGDLTDAIATALGQAIHDYHAAAPRRDAPGDALIGDILDELGRVFAGQTAELSAARIDDFLARARQSLADLAPVLRSRSVAGHVVRAHGDLHLGNIVLIDGRPVLFDALEFDERLGTCDVLYDLAFLVMDLCHRGLGRQANAVLGAYLLAAAGPVEPGKTDGGEDAGLAALPLFMAVRAAIRAMVVVQTTQNRTDPNPPPNPHQEAVRYLTEAIRALDPAKPVLIAIGGVSGTGKTLLARAVAPQVGSAPGAIHLRTDTQRKAGNAPVRYDPASRARVYRQMFDRARTLLLAGTSVVLDATFLDPADRAAAETLARELGLPFCGLWLTAPEAVLLDRVARRQGDASDADAGVVKQQMTMARKAAGWTVIDAGGAASDTLAAAMANLAGMLGQSGLGLADP